MKEEDKIYIEIELSRIVSIYIEDEYDVSLADEAYKEYVDNGCKSQPIDELWNELGIH